MNNYFSEENKNVKTVASSKNGGIWFFIRFKKFPQKKNSELSKKGFTLVELIVSLALLIVVLFITESALLVMTNLNKKTQSARIAIDEINFVIEAMSREIRTGTSYRCTDTSGFNGVADPSVSLPAPFDCASGGDSLLFISSTGGVIGYSVGAVGASRISKVVWPLGGSKRVGFITPKINEIEVTRLKFYVNGASILTTEQPRVNIVIEGWTGTDQRFRSPFKVYTSVTQRSPK